MSRAEEFSRNATEAERLARAARTDDERESYLKIARSWRELAQTADDVAKKRGGPD